MTDPDYSDLENLMADARLVYQLGLLTDEELEEIAAYVAEEATRRMTGAEEAEFEASYTTRICG
jgi:hypothetical protein